MLASLLIAAVSGMRAMTPLATVANAARAGELPRDNDAPALLAHPLVSAGTLALAAGELAGDKMKTAPDRIILPGMVARVATGAFAAASLAPRKRRALAALLGAGVAAGASYLTFHARMAALRRYGQTATGAVEDAVALGTAALAVRVAR
ncbi:DUF4126 family protein [Sphingomonas sp. RHCKR7]|uniref:DUF4126 family protein n=1 Tax=Sphingomonas folli TaxID=2862497 RepID=UPI001CA49EA0|nr:DUF4126 family protein [Sphingomonas folli]MBW6526085.1 DUF4126 family protein [Sphingomonas folli]